MQIPDWADRPPPPLRPLTVAVSAHAVRRYAERFPRHRRADADRLRDLFRRAKLVGAAPSGSLLYRCGEVTLVVRPEETGAVSIVTVIR